MSAPNSFAGWLHRFEFGADALRALFFELQGFTDGFKHGFAGVYMPFARLPHHNMCGRKHHPRSFRNCDDCFTIAALIEIRGAICPAPCIPAVQRDLVGLAMRHNNQVWRVEPYELGVMPPAICGPLSGNFPSADLIRPSLPRHVSPTMQFIFARAVLSLIGVQVVLARLGELQGVDEFARTVKTSEHRHIALKTQQQTAFTADTQFIGDEIAGASIYELLVLKLNGQRPDSLHLETPSLMAKAPRCCGASSRFRLQGYFKFVNLDFGVPWLLRNPRHDRGGNVRERAMGSGCAMQSTA